MRRVERGARIKRTKWVELSCLLCGEAVGTLTSPCESPTLGKVIGLAVLETAQAEKGNQVQVALAGGGVANATVADFPIYDPEKKRPRS